MARITQYIFAWYHRARNLLPIWYYAFNRDSRRIWLAHRPRLTGVQERVAAALARDGIAVLHISEFDAGKKCYDAMRAHAHDLGERYHADPLLDAHEKKKKGVEKNFLDYLWGGFGMQLLPALDDVFLRFLLDPEIIGTAGAYLGLAPKFHSVRLDRTRIVPSGADARLSQRWHRDPEDKKLVKVFLYFTDVDEQGAGPFTYVTGSQYGGTWRHIFPQRPPAGSYPPIDAVERTVPQQDIRVCLGRAGTIIFCDTSGLHCGGYSTTKQRLMLTGSFVSVATAQPFYFERVSPAEARQHFSSPLSQYSIIS